MRAGSLVLLILVLAAVVLGGSSQRAQVVQHHAARTGAGTGAGAGTGITPSPPPTITSVATQLNSVVLAVRLWFVALFRFIHELIPWRSGDHGSPNAGFVNATFPSNLEWNGVRPSKKELESMVFVKNAFLAEMASGKLASTTWLQSVSDREILRFVRHHNSNKDAALKSIKAHAQWRTSPLGSETLVRTGQARFGKSELNKEVFWLGVSKAGCPTLVVRTRAHDGKDYSEDPKIFSSFFVWVLEQGRLKYGAGSTSPICVILDRGPYYRGGKSHGALPDFSVVPRLVDVFKTLFQTINNNYPEILAGAHVVPVSFFFKMCYRVTSRVMDRRSRDRFHLVNPDKVASAMLGMFDRSLLPPHLGGTSTKGGLWDDGQWNLPGAMEEALQLLKEGEMVKLTDAQVKASKAVGVDGEDDDGGNGKRGGLRPGLSVRGGGSKSSAATDIGADGTQSKNSQGPSPAVAEPPLDFDLAADL